MGTLGGSLAAITVAALVALSACSGGVQIVGTVPPPPGTLRPDPSGLAETPAESPQATPAGTIVLTNYFFLDSGGGPTLVPVPRAIARAPAIGGATLHALLTGPTANETKAGIGSAIPGDTLLLGLTIEDGLATVDLSGEFAASGSEAELVGRIAQVVYTLTQFSTVTRVAFSLDGRPVPITPPGATETQRAVTRADFVDVVPPVFVETPRWGEPVSSPIRLFGTADVFEATFQADLFDAEGNRLFRRTLTATCGTGCRGDFRDQVAFSVDREQVGRLIVYTLSARDGSVEETRTYDVVLIP
jgi:spore germination protein GerM